MTLPSLPHPLHCQARPLPCTMIQASWGKGLGGTCTSCEWALPSTPGVDKAQACASTQPAAAAVSNCQRQAQSLTQDDHHKEHVPSVDLVAQVAHQQRRRGPHCEKGCRDHPSQIPAKGPWSAPKTLRAGHSSEGHGELVSSDLGEEGPLQRA